MSKTYGCILSLTVHFSRRFPSVPACLFLGVGKQEAQFRDFGSSSEVG